MIAVSNTNAIFVVANSANHAGKHTTYSTADKAGSLSDNLTPVGLHCLPKLPRGLASFVYNRNFFPKMANSEKVSGTVNNSTRTARAHSAQFSQRIYKVLSGSFCKKTFAETENVCIFVVRHDTNGINKVHTTRLIRRCPLSTFGLPKVSCRNEIGGNAFFLRKPQILSTLNF